MLESKIIFVLIFLERESIRNSQSPKNIFLFFCLEILGGEPIHLEIFMVPFLFGYKMGVFLSKTIPKNIFILLLIHSLMQHFVVGAGSETFPYFQNNKKTKIKDISFQMPSHLIFVTKFTFNGTCQLHY